MKIAGKPVKDADEKFVLTITKADVKSGAAKTSSQCAAAKALCRQTGCEEARVHFSRVYIRKQGKWLRFGAPPSLRNEVIAFDRGGEFAPGEYVIGPAQPIVRLDAPSRKRYDNRKNKTRSKNSGTKIKRPYHVVSGVRARMQADWE